MAVLSPVAWTWAAMGTTWRLYHSGDVGAELAGEVARLVEADEARWSRFRDRSEVAAVSRGAGRAVPVSPETVELLGVAATFVEQTAGVFTPLAGKALSAWGYAASLDRRPAGAIRSPRRAAPIGGRVTVDAARGTARIPAGTALDLGGIAKSWSAARAAALLRGSCGDPALLLDAGGDVVAVRGAHDVAVEAVDGHDGAVVRLEEGHGIATSGSGRRRWRNGDGLEAHHLIDPATGAPGRRGHATVVDDDVAAAEVWAKVLVLRPGWLGRRPQACALVHGPSGASCTPAWRRAVVA